MKKTGIVLSILVSALIIASCASAPQATNTVVKDKPVRRDLPSFFLNPPVFEDQIVGLGSAKMSSDSISRQTAVARARTDISFQMNARVEAMLTDYFQEGGVDDDTQAVTFVESISKQITNIDLENAKTSEVYAAADGSWFAMVLYPIQELVKEVDNVFERNESTAFAEFKADEALKRLETEIKDKPLETTANAEVTE